MEYAVLHTKPWRPEDRPLADLAVTEQVIEVAERITSAVVKES
jgi:hypothetical protein